MSDSIEDVQVMIRMAESAVARKASQIYEDGAGGDDTGLHVNPIEPPDPTLRHDKGFEIRLDGKRLGSVWQHETPSLKWVSYVTESGTSPAESVGFAIKELIAIHIRAGA